jgi:hypothetical protein
MTLHECTGIEKASTAAEVTSSTCATKGKGSFRTTPIVGKAIKVVPTLTETTFTENTEGETSGVHAVLHTTAGDVSFQITCSGIASANSIVENKEPEVGKMVFLGTGTAEFSGCAVKGGLATVCTVPATLITEPLTQTVKEMSVVFKPATGATFIKIPVSGASCPAFFKGEQAITGEARGTVTEAEPQSISFNSESGNNLKLAAQFTAKIHFGTTVGGTVPSAETP